MRKVHMFLFAVAVAVMLSVLALGAVAPTTARVVPTPVYEVAPGEPGGGQGGGGGG